MAVQHRQDVAQRAEALRDVLADYRDLVLAMDRSRILSSAVASVRAKLGTAIALGGVLEDEDLLVLRYWAGTQTAGLHNLEVPTSLGLGGKVAATGSPHVVPSYLSSRRITHHFDAPVADEGLQTMAAVPVRCGGQTNGVIYVGLRERLTSTGVLVESLQTAAEATSLALDVAAQVGAQRDQAAAGARNDIALDLHDTVGALLFRIGVEVRDLAAQPGCSESVSTRLQDMQTRIAEAASGLRECVAGLRRDRAGADAQDLVRVLGADCRAYQARRGLPTRLVVLTPLPELDDNRVGCLTRCVREALLNVEKHAEASCVVVTVSEQDGGLAVVVSDDSTKEPQRAERGVGLTSLDEEFGRLGGWFTFVHEPGEGSTVRGWLPAAS